MIIFNYQNNSTILFWRLFAVLWPSAVVLSNLLANESWLLDLIPKNTTTDITDTRTILELGAGCGLSGLVAALCLRNYQSRSVNVVLTDFNPLVLDNLQRNIHLNDVSDICTVVGLDFYEQSGHADQQWIAMNGIGPCCDPVDVVIAADIICQPSDAIAVANTLHDVLKPNGVAYIVCADAKHRFGVDRLYVECQRVGLTIFTNGISITSVNAHDDDSDDTKTDGMIRLYEGDIRNLELTTGYVHGMKFTLFTIRKY
jgi:predicted nicotinamide N-methyase